jgi:hypothetical protein
MDAIIGMDGRQRKPDNVCRPAFAHSRGSSLGASRARPSRALFDISPAEGGACPLMTRDRRAIVRPLPEGITPSQRFTRTVKSRISQSLDVPDVLRSGKMNIGSAMSA